MAVGPVERHVIFDLAAKFADVVGPTLVAGGLDIDLVISPWGPKPAAADHGRKLEMELRSGTIDNRMIMVSGGCPTFQHRDDLHPFAIPFRSMTIDLPVQQIREMPEILLRIVSLDTLELSLHTPRPVQTLTQGQGHGKGVGKLLDPDEIVKCLTICELILICSHRDVRNGCWVWGYLGEMWGWGVQSIKTICLSNIPVGLNRTKRELAVFRRFLRITGHYR